MISLNEIENAYNSYSGELFTYIMRSVYDHDAAEDLLQDVFIKLIRYSQKKEVNSDNIRALLYSIARSVCIDSARSSSKARFDSRDISDIPDIIPDRENPARDMLDAVNTAIDSLGEPGRSIILLRQNGLTYHEISSALRIPERTLKRKTAAAIAGIRDSLKEQGFLINNGTESHNDSFNE